MLPWIVFFVGILDVAGRSQTKANRLYVHPQQFKIVSSPPVHIHRYQPPPPPQHHHQSQPHVNQSTTMTSTMIRNTTTNNNNNNTNSRNLQPVARLLGTGVYLSTSPSFAAESASALASTPKQPQIITKTTTTTNNTTTPSVAHLVTSSVYEVPPQPPGQLKHETTSLSTATTTTTAATSKPILYLNRPSSKEYESRV